MEKETDEGKLALQERTDASNMGNHTANTVLLGVPEAWRTVDKTSKESVDGNERPEKTGVRSNEGKYVGTVPPSWAGTDEVEVEVVLHCFFRFLLQTQTAKSSSSMPRRGQTRYLAMESKLPTTNCV